MTKIFSTNVDMFDVLFKNFFETDSQFYSLEQRNSLNYPVDILKTNDGLVIEIAAVGLNESDIKIEVTEGNILRVTHSREKTEQKIEYLHRGISKKSFDFGWRIINAYDISKITATMDKGLLKIAIPYAKENSPKSITITKQ
jgi:molecular chaperone IbpA